MNEPLRTRLSGDASRFLQMLRDFGHFDQAAINEFLLVLAEQVGEAEETEISLDMVRHLAARRLFEGGAQDLHSGSGILAEDWTILFS